MAKSPSHRPLNLARTVPDSHSSASAATTPKKPPVEHAPERDAPRAAATTKANRTTAPEKHAAATKRRRRAVSSDAALSRFGLLPSAEGLARARRDAPRHEAAGLPLPRARPTKPATAAGVAAPSKSSKSNSSIGVSEPERVESDHSESISASRASSYPRVPRLGVRPLPVVAGTVLFVR